MKKTILSGIQPSGNLHIGNYIGAIQQWKQMQDEYDSLFCVVDLHAITVPQDPKVLREKVREIAAIYIAAGIDPTKSHIFIQSENPDHPYLAWILNCFTPFGQLERMTQFKDKSLKQKDATTAGLFDYPVLMAADILLYSADEVPVGEDQKQHIELTRDVAQRFNTKYGEIFTIPEPKISKETGRIMSLQDPTSKMSKSDDDANGAIFLLDTPEVVREKIKRAVTDSDSEVKYSEDKPAISNLLSIFSSVTDISIVDLEQKYSGVGYGQFKSDLADAVVEFLTPFQARYNELMEDSAKLDKILDDGVEYSKSKSSVILQKVVDAVGLSR
ncbi:MAG TPA: tryptophan--tRNA ligase [Candidatus Levybacteria bacterium]|nr:tryptophan--tRNA ligase [Candidatus Levybacteria bacterium]